MIMAIENDDDSNDDTNKRDFTWNEKWKKEKKTKNS